MCERVCAWACILISSRRVFGLSARASFHRCKTVVGRSRAIATRYRSPPIATRDRPTVRPRSREDRTGVATWWPHRRKRRESRRGRGKINRRDYSRCYLLMGTRDAAVGPSCLRECGRRLPKYRSVSTRRVHRPVATRVSDDRSRVFPAKSDLCAGQVDGRPRWIEQFSFRFRPSPRLWFTASVVGRVAKSIAILSLLSLDFCRVIFSYNRVFPKRL